MYVHIFVFRGLKDESTYVEIKRQLDAKMIFIADFIACSTCFGQYYAHHQELDSIIQMVAACGIWCCKDGKSNSYFRQKLRFCH